MYNEMDKHCRECICVSCDLRGTDDCLEGADGCMSNIRKEQRQQEAAERLAVISRLIPVMKQTAELAGFEVVGRITLKDKETGKEYR